VVSQNEITLGVERLSPVVYGERTQQEREEQGRRLRPEPLTSCRYSSDSSVLSRLIGASIDAT
jgi:hypothetical protein